MGFTNHGTEGIRIFLSLGFTQICPNPDVYGGISLLTSVYLCLHQPYGRYFQFSYLKCPSTMNDGSVIWNNVQFGNQNDNKFIYSRNSMI